VNEINNDMKSIKEDITSFPEKININYNVIEATMINIGRKIKKLTRDLIIKETMGIIKKISPINDKENVKRYIDMDFNSETINELTMLNDEYARFLGEIEVNKNDFNFEQKNGI